MAELRYRALLIGNATFPRDPHRLTALNGPLADIQALRQALIDDEVGLFYPNHVEALPDHDVQPLRERLDEFFSTAVLEDVLLLYYSGHGERDTSSTLYLCAHDTKSSSLRATALSALEINNLIEGSAASTIIIVLDCCHSGAFKGGELSIPVAGKGRYVLTSNRSGQLALAAAQLGQPSPFTGLLVHGLRHAVASGHLTVTELYKQVHSWMTASGATLIPQLRIAGEGEVIIARRGNRPLPPPPLPAEPLIEIAQTSGIPGTWRAQRVRTGGVDCILRVDNGTERYTIEYRFYTDHIAVVLLDGKKVYQGPRYLDCTFALGRRGTDARLKVSDDPDIQLWVDGKQLYTRRHAVTGSDSFLEHRALVVRDALLAAKAKVAKPTTVEVAPDVGRRRIRAVRGTTSRGVLPAPIIGVVARRKDQMWLTDRALHIGSQDKSIVVPYEELGAVTVTTDGDSLVIGAMTIGLLAAEKFAAVIDVVKAAVVYQDTGLGTPPPIHWIGHARPVGPRSHSTDAFDLVFDSMWGLVTAVTSVAVPIWVAIPWVRGFGWPAWLTIPTAVVVFPVAWFLAWLFLGLVLAAAVAIGRWLAKKLAAARRGFWPVLAIVAWVLGFLVAAGGVVDRQDTLSKHVEYGLSVRLHGGLTIGIGHRPDVIALGLGSRLVGGLLLTAAIFFFLTIMLGVPRWHLQRRR